MIRKNLILGIVLIALLSVGFYSGGLADQPDFPLIYIDEGCAGTHVGSAANPYDDFADINWTTGGDNSIYDYLDGTPSQSPTIYLNMDDEWREQLTVGTSGTATYPIVLDSYGSGADPIINGADLVETWTEYSATLDPTPAASNDDGYLKETTHTVNNAANDLYAGLVSEEQMSLQFRFTLNAPQGATITSAYLTVTANGNRGDGAEFDIYAHDTDNAGQITIWTDYTTAFAAKTSASTNWDLPATTTDVAYQSPSIVDVVQEIVDRGSWSSGNSIVLLVYSSSSTATFKGEAQNEGNNPPVLHVVYGVANVWQATLTTEPSQVFLDGRKGSKQISIAACDGANKWYWNSNVIYVYSASDPDTAYTDPGIEASQRMPIRLNDKDYITINGLDCKYSQWRGIDLYGGTSNTIIDGCTLQYNGDDGIQYDSTTDAGDSITVQNCTTRYNVSCGINPAKYSTNWTIQNNDCQYDNQGAGSHGGIKAWGANSGGHIIQNNTCKNASTNGYGIWIDQVPTACTVRYNLCQDNSEGQIVIEKCSSCEVYYNLAIGSDGSENGIELSGTNAEPVDSTEVYNNVFYNNGHANIVLRGNGADSITNNLIRNNIAVLGSNRMLLAKDGGENDGTNGSGNVYEYNCFGVEASNFIEWETGNYDSTYDDWEISYGDSTHSVEFDPLMTDPANDDFTLQKTSPCRDAGTDVSLTVDYRGSRVPKGSAPDIGAYEYFKAIIWQPIASILNFFTATRN